MSDYSAGVRWSNYFNSFMIQSDPDGRIAPTASYVHRAQCYSHPRFAVCTNFTPSSCDDSLTKSHDRIFWPKDINITSIPKANIVRNAIDPKTH